MLKFLAEVPLQLLPCHIAVPRNLAKRVTVQLW
jgi:hypothetical protein